MQVWGRSATVNEENLCYQYLPQCLSPLVAITTAEKNYSYYCLQWKQGSWEDDSCKGRAVQQGVRGYP